MPLRVSGLALWSVAAWLAAQLLVPTGATAAERVAGLVADATPSRRATTKFLFLHDPPARWPSPPAFHYNHSGAPAGLTEEAVVELLRGAMQQWREACGLAITYAGTTTARVDADGWADPEMGRDGVNVIGWMDADDPFSFISAEAGVFLPLPPDTRSVIVEADVRLFADSFTHWTASADLAYLLLHELGHALGIGHSDVSGAVMSGQPHTAYSSQTTLQDDDAHACRALYSTGGRDVIEFHHAGFDHYFVTSLPQEVAALDDGTIPGWTRTGAVFRADEFATPGAVPVCRFFSGATFAPRSSHFYTPFEGECESAKAMPAWQFEGEPFALRLPGVAGECERGTRALFRLYNDGRGWAPNHRYTTSLVVRADMVARGWRSEGVGALGVAGCVPAD